MTARSSRSPEMTSGATIPTSELDKLLKCDHEPNEADGLTLIKALESLIEEAESKASNKPAHPLTGMLEPAILVDDLKDAIDLWRDTPEEAFMSLAWMVSSCEVFYEDRLTTLSKKAD